MNTIKRPIFNNILNCRDLGGYETENGITQFGRFYRCGMVCKPSDDEIHMLEKLGIKTVIDLRGEYEVSNISHDIDRFGSINYVNISLYEANAANANPNDETLVQTYCYIADNYIENVKRIFDAIADAHDGGIMFNCFFGKDRTGILATLLLTVFGVCEDDIIADYQVSYTYLRRYIETHSNLLWATDSERHFSSYKTIILFMNYLTDKYGSVMDYIYACGVSSDTIRKIQKKIF